MKKADPIFEAVESFFVDYLQRARGCSRCTLESYRDTLRLFLDFAAQSKHVPIDRLRLAEFDVDLVQGFLDSLECQRHNRVSTRNCRLAVLRSFFAHVLRRNPDHAARLARILALPPKRCPLSPPRYLDPPVVQSLLRNPNRQTRTGRRDYALLLFLYNTGARVSEMISLRRKDLLPGPAVNLRGKGNKLRVVPLWPETIAAIKAQLPSIDGPPDQPLFQSTRGQPLSRHGIYYILSRHGTALHRADPRFPARIWPHLMRHSCAVALLQAGVDLITIRDQLGHVSVATTSRYATSNLKLKRDALEAFWTASGLASTKRKTWRPSPKLSQFLQSI
ncbi:MAG: tyrosine-type recombinase/integrase [Verrucomicrobiia bacterium]